MPTRFALTLRLRDLDAFRAACRCRGWEFREGQRTYRWFGRQLEDDAPSIASCGRCSHAVAISGRRYEIGLIDYGVHWLPVWDDGPQGGLPAALGVNGSILWQAYVMEMAQQA